MIVARRVPVLRIFAGAFLGLMLGRLVGAPFFGILIGIALGLRMKSSQPFGTEHGKVINMNRLKIPGLRGSWQLLAHIILVLILLYFFRPWFHELVMGFYRIPAVLAFVLLAAGSAAAFLRRKQKTGTVLVALTLLSFIILIFSNVIMQRYIVSMNEYNKVTMLPDSSEVRILPKAVANRFLEDSLQKSREKIAGLDIVNINGTLAWTAPRVPDGAILYLTQPVNGVMVADATKSVRKTMMVTKEISVGEGIGITDSIFWKLYKKTFFMDIDEIYYILQDDNILTVAPVIKYRFRFPVMIPYFAGVYVLDENSEIDFHTPDELRELPLFQDNWAFPESLTRLYVDSYKYHLGVWNAWFLHKDQIEISDVYGQENQQPFLMPTQDGLRWMIATEPYGQSYGIFKIFSVDALTGKIDMLELNEDQTLTGPVRVVSYVKKKFPRIDWATAKIVEPRPYVIDGKLYWMLSITPNDFAGISYSVFVNSEDNDVIAFENDMDVYRFIREGVVQNAGDDTDEEPDTSSKISEKISDIEDQLAELKEMLKEV
ncbi:MAG: hypothetical protein ABH879_04410 [archaeon]